VILIADYDDAWPRTFASLRDRAWPLVAHLADSIEHVGSTSVPGLAAKPIIDLDIVVSSADALAETIRQLATLGYRHIGDLGVTGREAFDAPGGDPPHHLYVCVRGATELRNHLRFRNYLRASPETASAYAALKRRLAAEYGGDRNGYSLAKTEFIRACLAAAK
jgi:GrpB-like predicted nucleotidyltransferase (UPF0157 family)